MNVKKSFPGLVPLLCLCLLCLGCAGDSKKAPPSHLPTNAALESMEMELAWHMNVNMVGDSVHEAYVLDDLILIETRKCRLYAADLNAGVLNWQTQLPFPIEFGPARNENRVFAVGGERLYSICNCSGRIKWQRKLTFPVTGAPAATEFAVAVPGRYILNGFSAPDGSMAWEFRARGRIDAAPTAREKLLFFGDGAGWVYCIRTDLGQPVWEKETLGAIAVAPWVSEDRVYAGSMDFKIYACDRETGAPLWDKSTGAPIRERPVLAGEDIYAPSFKNGVHVMKAADGGQRWVIDDVERVLAIGKKRVYMLHGKDEIVAVERDSGQVSWRTRDERHSFFPSNLSEKSGLLVLINKQGKVAALREK